MVIDPGMPAEKIAEQLTGATVRWIVATHGHPGHVGGKDELKALVGGETAIHSADAKQFLRSADRYLIDGDELEFGEFKMSVLHTPGHTPGSVCLVIANHAFVGDTILAGGIGAPDARDGPAPPDDEHRHALAAASAFDGALPGPRPGDQPRARAGAEPHLSRGRRR